MPMVKFPYTKEGEKNAKAAAREYGGKYISDKKVPKQKEKTKEAKRRNS